METQQVKAKTPPVFSANDRCDSCGSQAYVLVELDSGELLFCGHHWNRHKKILAETAISILDETDKILPPKPNPEDVE